MQDNQRQSGNLASSIEPRKLTFSDHLGLFVWRGITNFAAFAIRSDKVKFPASRTEFSYGTHPDKRLDYIEPAKNVPALTPVVYLHGGGWVCGSKELLNKQMAQLAAAGHPVFNVEYPLAPEQRHPTQLRSVLAALHWIHQNYPQYEDVHLMGDSAGGNLAAMAAILVANPELTSILGENIDVSAPRIKSIVALYAVLDRLTWIDDKFPGGALFMRNYVGEKAFLTTVDPLHSITPMDLSFKYLPPVFIAVGSKDRLQTSSQIFHERLQAEDRPVKYKIYAGAAHGFFSFGTGSIELLQDIMVFLKAEKTV